LSGIEELITAEASKPHASSSCGSDGPREAHPTTLQSSSPRRDEPNQVNKWDPGSHPKPPRIEASLPFRSAAQSHRRLSPNPSGDPIQGHPPPPPPPPATGPSSLRRRTAPVSPSERFVSLSLVPCISPHLRAIRFACCVPSPDLQP
jgi:hypothetical protein